MTQTFISKVETGEISQEDLRVIADIGKIAINSRFMAEMLEGTDD